MPREQEPRVEARWWEVDYRELPKGWWQDTDYEGNQHFETIEEARAMAMRWVAAGSPHVDGRMRYYETRVVEVVEFRKNVELHSGAQGHIDGSEPRR